MTKQEQDKLLEEAKMRYPPGTVFKSVNSGNEHISNGNVRIHNINPFEIKVDVTNRKYFTSSVYKEENIWAEIISKPEVKPSKDKPFYVIVTEENKEVLSKWRNVEVEVGKIVGLSLWDNDGLGIAHNSVGVIQGSDYTFGNEITFEQFLELYPKCKENKSEIIQTPKTELTELPEKWTINISNKELIDLINKNQLCNIPLTYNSIGENNFVNCSRTYCSKDINFTEITFYQFKKWVLKENVVNESIVDLIQTEFKKGDYIVTLEGDFESVNCAKKNYCFKIRVDHHYIRPEIDLYGSNTNGALRMFFDKSGDLKDWRYATKEEAKEYEKQGKPYDVTILATKAKEEPKFIVGKWYKTTKNRATFYAKYLKSDEVKEFYTSEHIMSGWKKLIYSFENGYSWELLTDLSEIQQYLPEGHIDKIKTDIIPEYVEIIFSEPSNWYKLGEKYQVFGNDIKDNKLVYFESLTSKSHWIEAKDTKSINKEAFDKQNKPKSLVGRYFKRLCYDITSCKIGDYLKILNDHTNYFIIEKYGRLEKYDMNHWELMPEGFDSIKSDTFVLPKKWCISEKYKEVVDYLNLYSKHESKGKYSINDKQYAHFPPYNTKLNYHLSNYIEKDYTEITLEQFKKHVLKETSFVNTGINSGKLYFDNHLAEQWYKTPCKIPIEMYNFKFVELDFGKSKIKDEVKLIEIKKLKTFNNQ